MRIGAQVTPANEQTELPGVSVIVCARNEEENLQDYLHNLLTQDYPLYEVIVVDDGSEDQTRMILEQYARQCNNMYHTFVPHGARVVSTKKLALTIGIKAAHYDYILLTDADCRPESKNWIKEMMGGFADANAELVLGFSPYFEHDTLLSRLISYDTLWSGLLYMGMARAGHPYMGVGRNLAYRRGTFFAHNGFQGLLNERSGDDDLFVNKVATNKNTRVVCNRDSLTWSSPKPTWGEWMQQKRRHLSVSPLYRVSSKLRIGVEPMIRALLYGLLILCALYGTWSLYVALGVWGLRYLVQWIILRVATWRLGMKKFGGEMVLYDLVLPIITLSILITKKLRRVPVYW
jgi:cellulose synthase/poly-beta-1,6-N-acetylglucosamine synthase-like glycosyltransferase